MSDINDNDDLSKPLFCDRREDGINCHEPAAYWGWVEDWPSVACEHHKDSDFFRREGRLDLIGKANYMMFKRRYEESL